jgi:hypothetical protein
MSRVTKDHPALVLLADTLAVTSGPHRPEDIAKLLGHALHATGYELVPKVRAAAAAPLGRFAFRGYEGRAAPLAVTLTDERGRDQAFELPLSVEYEDGVMRFSPDLAALDDDLHDAIAAGTFGWTVGDTITRQAEDRAAE